MRIRNKTYARLANFDAPALSKLDAAWELVEDVLDAAYDLGESPALIEKEHALNDAVEKLHTFLKKEIK